MPAKKWLKIVLPGALPLLAVGLFLLARTMFVGPITSESLEQRINTEVPRRFAIITGSPLRDVGHELRIGRRRLTRLHDRAERYQDRQADRQTANAADLSDPKLMQEVARLHDVLLLFNRWLALWQKTPVLERERIAGDIIVEVLQERVQWSHQNHMPTQRRMRAPEVGRQLHGGVAAAALWPVRLVMGGQHLQRPGYMLRYIFFPDTPRMALLFWNIAGFFPIVLTMGYAFCWLGERFHQSIIGFVGLAYFFYAGMYVLALLLLLAGLF